jgi:hypothetical protein
MSHRLQLYVDEGNLDRRELAQRLWSVLQAWRASEPRADRFRFEVEGGVADIAGVDDCERALEQNTYRWKVGDSERTSYEPTVFVGNAAAPLLRVTYSCGIGALDIEGIFAPSRFVAIVDRTLLDADGAALLRTFLLKAVELLRPRFGHVGSLDHPRPAMPLEPSPTPPVGWLTYLSHAYRGIPSTLPSPSVAYPAPDGTLLVAHPELFLEYKSAHRDAVRALREKLALSSWRTG